MFVRAWKMRAWQPHADDSLETNEFKPNTRHTLNGIVIVMA